MKILGIRTSSKAVRYAILELKDDNVTFLNSDSESKLTFPLDKDKIEERVLWLYQEMERIYRSHPDISHIAIKENEYNKRSGETAVVRQATYLSSAVLLFAAHNNINTSLKIYASIEHGMSSSKIKNHSETIVGRTVKYWDEKIADAIAVAYSVFEV